MSVERLQTVISVSSEGIPQLLADLQRVQKAMQESLRGGSVNAGGAGTGTNFENLSQRQRNQLTSVAPRATNELDRMATRLIAADQKLEAARLRQAEIIRKETESESAFKARVLSADAGVNTARASADAAQANYNKALGQLVAEVTQQVNQERQAQASNKSFNDSEAALRQQRLAAMRRDATIAFGGDEERARANRELLVQEAQAEKAQAAQRRAQMRANATAAFGGLPSEADRTRAARQRLDQEDRDARTLQAERLAAMRRDATHAFGSDPNRARVNSAANLQENRDAARLRQQELAQMRRGAQAAFGGNPEQNRQARAALDREEADYVRERRAFIARRRAEAREAFSRLPSDTALTDAEVSRITTSPTRRPEDSDKVYRARQLAADAATSSSIAERNYAATIEKATMGAYKSREAATVAVEQATRAQQAAARRVLDAERRLEVAIENQALAHAQSQRRSIREDFITGFRGRGSNPAAASAGPPGFGEQLGQAFKFSAFYGTAYKMLFALTQTLQATFNEGVAFQQGMTDLALATGRPKEHLDEIAKNLSASAVRAGFAPSQGIEIGARSLGLYGAVDSDAAIQDRVMTMSSRVVNQLAVGSGKQPIDLQGDIAAIGQALGGGAASQFRIADLDAYMTKKFGIAQGSTLEVVGQSASVGKAAGFTDEQLFAIAADMMSRTGQSGSAVSGYMAQIFSRGGEGSLVDVARKQGIDPSQNLAQIIEQLSEVYKNASNQDQAQISAAFGRGKIQNAAVALLGDYSEVQSRANQAAGGAATGQADEQFKIRMDNIGGQVAQLQGVLRDFASLMGESGLLDVVGLGIVTFREMVEAINGFLKIWNELPNAIQDVLLGLGALAVASKFGVLGKIGGGALGTGVRSAYGIGRDASLGMSAQRAFMQRGFMQGGQFMSGATGRLVSPTSSLREFTPGVAANMRAGASGFARAGAAAVGMTPGFAVALGGLMAIGALKNSAERIGAAADSATAALNAPSAVRGSDSATYKAYGGELRSLATQNDEATGWFQNAITLGQANNGPEALARRLRAEAKRQEAIGGRVQITEGAAATPDQLAIKSLGATDISAGFQALEAGGATAAQQLKALRDVLYGTADAADAAAKSFSIKDFSGESASGLVAAASGALKGVKSVDSGKTSKDFQADLQKYLTGGEAQKRLASGLREFGVKSEGDISPEIANQIGAEVGKGYADKVFGGIFPPEVVETIQKRINRAIARDLLKQARDVKTALSGGKRLSAEEATATAQGIVAQTAAQIGATEEFDSTGRIALLRNQMRGLRKTRRSSNDPNGYIEEQLDQTRRDISNNQFEELERLRRVAQQNAKSKAEINQIGQGFLRKEIHKAIQGGNTDLLIKIIGQAGMGSIAIAQNAINDAIKLARAAQREATRMAQAAGWMGAQAASFLDQQIAAAKAIGAPTAELEKQRDALGKGANAQRDIDKGNQALKGVKGATAGGKDKNVYSWTGADYYNPMLEKEKEKDKKKEKEDRDTAAEIAAAKAAAYATRSGSQIGAARAAILSARAAMATAKKNTVEYWNAMASLFSAQDQMRDAVLAYRTNLARLGADTTNPLVNARLAVREAARRLRADAGKSNEVKVEDRVALKESRAARESTAFSQRLQAVQTAEELGRISHAKYINYLENEKKRLQAIGHRTYQQQDQLNQIDRLLQESSKQMQGQFNLGDIKLPTPYQVRRYIESTSPSKSERLATSVQTISNFTMHVNGADVAMVKRVVIEQVGKGGRVRGPAPRRR